MNSARAVILAAALAACSPSAPSQACLTRADCADGEQCVGGRCVASFTDSGPGVDAGQVDAGRDASAPDDASADSASDAVADRDAPAPVDAFVPIDAGPVPGESCANPIRLTLDASGQAHAEGDLAPYRFDHRIFCGAAEGPDVVYVVDIPDTRVDVEVRTSGDAMTDTMVSFSESCTGTGEFYSCQDDRSPESQDTRMLLRRYGSPQLFVLVRGYDAGDVGSFTLDITVGPVADTSSCTTPIDLTGGAFVVGWHTAADLAPHPSCLPADPLVSDVYRLDRASETNIDYLGAYFGPLEGAIASIDSCTAPVTEAFCARSIFDAAAGYYGIERSTLPLPRTPVGYLVVTAPDASSSYSFTVYP